MSDETWNAVDAHFEAALIATDAVLAGIGKSNEILVPKTGAGPTVARLSAPISATPPGYFPDCASITIALLWLPKNRS